MSGSSYDKSDYWAVKAKKEGYPARSVYKLMELDAKFGLVKPGMRILDVGAAPGSWTLWTLRRLAGTGFLAAVDLQSLGISPKDANFAFVRGDINDPAIRETLAAYGPYDLVLSDAAPSTSGNSGLDTDRSEALVETVMDCAEALLKTGGSLVAKLFVGGGERAILDRMRSGFATARGFKPEACRSVSFETYLVAVGRKKKEYRIQNTE